VQSIQRQLYHCHGCRTQTSLISGTVFAKILLPLMTWFQGICLLTQAKNSICGGFKAAGSASSRGRGC
jgi:hypothetical protein